MGKDVFNRDTPQRFTVEWDLSDECPPVEHILRYNVPDRSFEVEGSAVRLSAELACHPSYSKDCETTAIKCAAFADNITSATRSLSSVGTSKR